MNFIAIQEYFSGWFSSETIEEGCEQQVYTENSQELAKGSHEPAEHSYEAYVRYGAHDYLLA